jgi:hypothetical protein
MSIAAERWDYQYSGGYQADGSSGYKQNQAGFYQKNASGSQNIGRFQQAPNLNTQNSSYGQSQHNLDGRYPPNLNTAQKSTVGPPLFSNAKPDGQSLDASNDSPYRGAIEELDGFCMKGKVK